MKRLFFSSRLALLIILSFGGISLSAETWTAVMELNDIYYRIHITGRDENAVADSAYVVHRDSYYNLSGAISIASSLTYKYEYSKIVGYDAYGNSIYQSYTRYLTCPVKGIDKKEEAVTSWGAFEDCTGLTSVYIPGSVTTIGSHAFYGCTGLTSINIPGSVTTIGSWAFYGCTGLTSINIPGSMKAIGDGAFCGCMGLTSINIPNSVTRIGNGAFALCSGLTNIDIPNSVTYIGESAFALCSGLTSLTIGESVRSIDRYAFDGCHIKELTWNAKNCRNGYRLGDNTHEIEIISIGPNVEYLPSGVISESLVTEVNLPNSLKEIGNGAFYDCLGLTNINIPNSVTVIGYRAFYGCSGLTNIDIPNSILSIDKEAFTGCTGLNGSLTIPTSLTEIGIRAFCSCKGLKKLYWNAKDCVCNHDVDSWPPFSGCDSLSHIVIGSEVEYIGDILNVQSDIDTVTCYAIVPPIISKNCFSQKTYNNAVLCVPKGSVEIYQNTKRWQDFFKCIAIETIPGSGEDEPLRGDVNDDGSVNISDVTALIDYLLGIDSSINQANADVNDDGSITIADVTALIDLLLWGN